MASRMQLRHQLGRRWRWNSVNMTNGTFRSAVATVRMRCTQRCAHRCSDVVQPCSSSPPDSKWSVGRSDQVSAQNFFDLDLQQTGFLDGNGCPRPWYAGGARRRDPTPLCQPPGSVGCRQAASSARDVIAQFRAPRIGINATFLKQGMGRKVQLFRWSCADTGPCRSRSRGLILGSGCRCGWRRAHGTSLSV
jgi:hypothetical protein